MKSIYSFALTFFPLVIMAQERDSQWHSFDAYKAVQKVQYEDFSKINKEQFTSYSQKMREEWETFVAKKGIRMPMFPEPGTQPVAPKILPLPQVLPFSDNDGANKELLPRSSPKDPAEPAMPEIPEPISPIVNFIFYGTDCKVRMGTDFDFSLPMVSENACADVWDKLLSASVSILLEDCFKLKESMQLGDWGMIDLMRVLGETYYGVGNEAVFFQMFTLAFAGYQVRLCKKKDKLILLVPFDSQIYDYSYISIDGEKFYLMAKKNMESESYQVFNMATTGEKTPSVLQRGTPRLAYKEAEKREFRLGEGKRAVVSPNKNLIDFYDAYPLSEKWNYYVLASLGTEIKKNLYPHLREKIAGKTEQAAVDYLLHFVQKGFAYKTDRDQFGYERPFFGDENFYYPYNDCEDRSILLAILVRDLLDLDVVLLLYPGHLSTAIKFSNDIVGAYYDLEEWKFYSCDPTYLGAKAGDVMPAFSESSATVIRLN